MTKHFTNNEILTEHLIDVDTILLMSTINNIVTEHTNLRESHILIKENKTDENNKINWRKYSKSIFFTKNLLSFCKTLVSRQ